MELKPHDLIRIKEVEVLQANNPLPDWVGVSLARAPFVVVRRAGDHHPGIPVGVRGSSRGERAACYIPTESVLEIVTPDQLSEESTWPGNFSPVLSTLKAIKPVMEQLGLTWGPTGSAGFELATGRKTLKETSDLDLLINTPKPFSLQVGDRLLNQLNALATVRLDIQLETPLGGVALLEYLNEGRVLVKGKNGPFLLDRNQLWY